MLKERARETAEKEEGGEKVEEEVKEEPEDTQQH